MIYISSILYIKFKIYQFSNTLTVPGLVISWNFNGRCGSRKFGELTGARFGARDGAVSGNQLTVNLLHLDHFNHVTFLLFLLAANRALVDAEMNVLLSQKLVSVKVFFLNKIIEYVACF